MSGILAWLWDALIKSISWAVWLLVDCIIWLAGLVSANWLLSLWVVLATAAVILYLWARSQFVVMARRVHFAENHRDAAISERKEARKKARDARDDAQRARNELAKSDNALRRERDEERRQRNEAREQLEQERQNSRSLRDHIRMLQDKLRWFQ